MRRDCRRIEEALAEGRPLNDTELAHVESCARCRRVTEELSRLDEELPNLLPEAPDGLAERTIAAVEGAEPRQSGGRAFLARRTLVAAASFLLIGVVVLNVRNAIQRGESKRTMGDMRTIATAVESYSIDGNHYPSNSGKTRDALKGYLEQSYVKPSAIPLDPRTVRWEPSSDTSSEELRALENEDGLASSGTFGNRGTGLPDAQPEDKKRSLRQAYERERKGGAAAKRQQAAEVARRKAERDRLARRQAERDLLGRSSASDDAQPPAPSAPARGLSSKDQAAAPAPAASPAPTAEEFNATTRLFRAAYGKRSSETAQPEKEARVADAEGDEAKITFSSGSYLAFPDADGDEAGQKTKSAKSDVSLAGGSSEQITYRLDGQSINDPVSGGGSALQVPVESVEADAAQEKNESRSDVLAENMVVPGELGQDAPAKAKSAPGARELSRANAAGGSPAPISSPRQQSASAIDSLIVQMGFGALGYEPEAWKGVSLDRPVYFENTYLGGNARLAYLDRRAASLRLAGRAIAPHRGVGLPEQPFDAPERGAVALQVDASEAHVSAGEPRRVFLQVGIAGTEDAAWRRPPASVVLLPLLGDAREAQISATIATLRAGLEERDLLAVVSEAGPLSFSAPAEAGTESVGAAPDEAREVLRGLAKAYAAVEGGSSLRTRRLVILADRPVADDLRRQVHRLALKDVVTSVVSIGSRAGSALDSHAAIAQAGQGNLHLVDRADGLSTALDDELDSLTRVVARALRLNIRPAEGVRLIQVLGSRPLAKREVKEVKAREKAVDRSVERTTGIGSDRGADDPGLQTVLPYFLAGDRHVVIVELEVDGPGPLADVSLKIKDLVEMENRSLRASASLSRTPAERTPRQQQVSRNVAGFAVAKILRDAEVQLAAGGRPAPIRLRALAEQLLADPHIASEADARLLETYARLLSEGSDPRALAASIECARLARLGRATP